MPPVLQSVIAAAAAVALAGRADALSTACAICPQVAWQGRAVHQRDGSAAFDWPGVSFTVAVSGATEVSATFAMSTSHTKLRVVVDGVYGPVFWANSSVPNGLYTLASGLNAAANHTVEVVNAMEAMHIYASYEPNAWQQAPKLVSVQTDGVFLPPPNTWSRKLLAIGDSITAGSGVSGTPPCHGDLYTSDATLSYATLLASAFSAQRLGVLAWSGIGVYANCCDEGETMAGKVTHPLAWRESWSTPPPQRLVSAWDFNNPTRPDVIVCNLGTNDFFNRTDNATFTAAFVASYTQFLLTLTQARYSNYSTLFLGVGPITQVYGPAVEQVVANLRAAHVPVHVLNFTGVALDGCDGHPGVVGHQQMAAIAQPIIAAAMGWTANEDSSGPTAEYSEAAAAVITAGTAPAPVPVPALTRSPSRSEVSPPLPAPPPTGDVTLYVRSDGSGNYTSVQAALDACSPDTNAGLGHVTLHVLGYFWEQVWVSSSFAGGVTLIGDGGQPADATIAYNLSGAVYSTWYAQTMMIQAANVTLINVAVVNSAGDYNAKGVTGQSPALHLDVTAAFFACWNCELLAAIDTLYTGGASYGLRSYFYGNYINGSTDCLFGGSSTVWEGCDIDMSYTVTAPRGEPGAAYLILDSSITTPSAVLLGRPWGQLSTVVLKNCYLGRGVGSAGWDDWGHGCTDHNGATDWWCSPLLMAEYNSTGPGADPSGRVWWSAQLTPSEAAGWSRGSVLQGWQPAEGLTPQAAAAVLRVNDADKLRATFGAATVSALQARAATAGATASSSSSSSSPSSSSVSSTVFNVKDYGAVGDGQHNDTSAIQAAMNAAAAGSIAAGGAGVTLLFPGPQAVYLTWPVALEGAVGITVQFQAGAVLLAPQMDQWPSNPSQWPLGQTWLLMKNCTDLTVAGGGQYEVALDGQGAAWWAAYRKSSITRPTSFWQIENCTNVLLQQLRYQNSPNFHIVPNGVVNITAQDVSIFAPGDSPNTDGFDFGKCTGVVVRRVNVSNGDDSVAIKPGTRDILIEDSIFINGHGASVGSLGEHGSTDQVENMLVRNCTFINTQGAAKVKAWQGGAGYARNLTWTNLTVVGTVAPPLQLTQFYCPHDPAGCTPANTTVSIYNVTISRVYGSQAAGQAGQFNCTAAFPCTGISLSDIAITSSKGPKGGNEFACANAYGTAVNVIPDSCLKPGSPPAQGEEGEY